MVAIGEDICKNIIFILFKGFFIMQNKLALAIVLGLTLIPVAQAADSCYDLWHKRNAIFDGHGYCFSSDLASRIFDNSDCSTKNPRLSRAERKQVRKIKRQERRRKCKVD
jgi:hypothetical protein